MIDVEVSLKEVVTELVNARAKNFTNWIMNKTRGEDVGIAGQSNTCPIATFVREKLGDKYRVSVGGSTLTVTRQDIYEHVYVDLPLWAKMFIHAIDKQPEGTGVTRNAALHEMDFLNAVLELGVNLYA